MGDLSLLRKFGAEAMECGSYCEWFEYRHPDAYNFLAHIPNERAGKLARIALNLMGVKKGVSDYLLFRPYGGFVGMALEFKATGKTPSSVSKEQEAWLGKFRICGWFTGVAFGVDQAIEITNAYLGERITHKHWFTTGIDYDDKQWRKSA